MGSAEERSSGSSMVSNSGEETTLLEPTRQLQAVHDHGNQSKGIVASKELSLIRIPENCDYKTTIACIASVPEREQKHPRSRGW